MLTAFGSGATLHTSAWVASPVAIWFGYWKGGYSSASMQPVAPAGMELKVTTEMKSLEPRPPPRARLKISPVCG